MDLKKLKEVPYFFRGRALHDGQYVGGLLTVTELKLTGEIVSAIAYIDTSRAKHQVKTIPVDAASIGMFTRMFDCNDYPIFEGDVLRRKGVKRGQKYQVRRLESDGRFVMLPSKDEDYVIALSENTAKEVYIVAESFED